MKTSLLIIAAFMASGLSVFGQATDIQGSFSAGDGVGFATADILDASGSLAASGWVVRYGNFDSAFTDVELSGFAGGGFTAAELASLNTSFQQLFTWDIGDGAGAGQFSLTLSNPNGTSFSDERMYLLVYNVTDVANVNDATEFMLLRNDFDFGTGGRFPLVPQALGPIASGMDMDITLQTALLGSVDGADFQMMSVAIPEPSTWAMIVSCMVGAVALRRFRKKA